MDYGSPPRELGIRSKRPSSRSPSPNSKRRRISPSPSQQEPPRRPSNSFRPTRGPPVSEPCEPRRPVVAAPEDKARNRRLFGGILGIVGNGGRGRDAGLRRPVGGRNQAAVMDRQARERKGEEMMKFRKEKEERDRILRECEQMRSEARFLRTRTKPSLMYRPYILTDEQKDTLDDQISDTEEDILEKIEKWQDEHPEQMLLGWHRLPSTRQMRRRRDNYSSRSKSRSGSSRSRTRLGSERGDKMDVDGEKTFKPERRESMAESRNGDVTMGLDGAESRKNSLGSPPPPVPKPKAEVEEAPAVKGPETAPEQEQAPALMEPELEQETNKVDVEMKVVEEHEDDDEIETSEGVSLIY